MERASQEEQNDANFSSIAPSSEELGVRKENLVRIIIITCHGVRVANPLLQAINFLLLHLKLELQVFTAIFPVPQLFGELPNLDLEASKVWRHSSGGSLGACFTQLLP